MVVLLHWGFLIFIVHKRQFSLSNVYFLGPLYNKVE